jgi:two-component system sensor histidine kinase/response regulator
VLIVDDNAAAREIVDGLLQDVVRHTDSVASAPEALSAIRQNDADAPYDVVFMDWRMPGMDGLQAARAIKGDTSLRHQPVNIKVTAFGREEVRDEAERLKLDGFLVKPVTKSMVVDSLINAFVDEAESAAVASGAQSEGVTLAGMRILLTEDNDINQQIAVELLEGVGATVTVAHHGGEAVALLTGGPVPPPFDVVLMDLQMPVMDGHQATKKIRADGRFAGLPIIAMTAHATVEERDACLADGMNGHVSKPIEPAVLFATLAALHRSGEAPSAPAGVPRERSGELPAIPGLDAADGLARVAGNAKLYRKLLHQFADQQSIAVAQISGALAASDHATAERLAHTLRGVAGNLGAATIQAAAAALEKVIRAQAPAAEIEAKLAYVASVLEPLLGQLRTSLASPVAPGPVSAPPADPAQVKAATEKLIQLLTGFDAAATAFVEEHGDLLRPMFAAGGWRRFKQHVENFEFADALALIEQARNK